MLTRVRLGHRARGGPRGLLLGLSLMLVAAVAAESFNFSRVEVILDGDNIVLDAEIDFALNDTALEALEHGVPLTFVIHVQVRRADAWVWESDVLDRRLRKVLSYHPLSSLYGLHDLVSDTRQNFATRSAALRTLGELKRLQVGRLDELDPAGGAYEVRLNAYLDIEALPLPMRPLAHVSPDWDLESDTWVWLLRP
jgi:hypothetical protein